jgi:hypothetical protein
LNQDILSTSHLHLQEILKNVKLIVIKMQLINYLVNKVDYEGSQNCGGIYVIALSRKNTVLGTGSGITYELWSVNSIRWWCWNIATDEREVDYWSSEVFAFVVNIGNCVIFAYSMFSIAMYLASIILIKTDQNTNK